MRHQLSDKKLLFAILMFGCALCAPTARSQEKPFFVTYTYDLEEPGNLELETKTAIARPDGGTHFGASALELEYGVNAWWTSELYLDGQATSQDSTVFTGFRLENRFRPLMHEHFINPALYVEFESISDADKTLLEVVGHDRRDGTVPAVVLATEGQPPALEPSGAAQRRVRTALTHALRIQVRAVGRVQRHAGSVPRNGPRDRQEWHS